MKQTKWDIGSENPALSETLVREFSLSHLCARLLVARGMTEPAQVRAFLGHDVKNLHDPMLLSDMKKAVSRIRRAVEAHEKIAVYGDYDADGITATYILTDYFQGCGADCRFYIPDRMEEGYGVNLDTVDTLIDDGVSLIVTVDTGITAQDAVAHAKKRGCDFVITDHHECRETLPEAEAVVNPHRRDEQYPFVMLAGVCVAWKLICALAGECVCRYLPFVSIGTIADVMPLYGENRVIVSEGLRLLENTENTGLRALLAAAGVPKGPFRADHVGFALSPRINAAGRMEHAAQVVSLFFETAQGKAHAAAEKLCELNRMRQAQEGKIYKEALALLDGSFDEKKDAAIVLAGEGWHHGVIGIVASRLSGRFQCPVILLSMDGEMAKGSGRSFGSMNLYEAVCGAADYLEQYGGHEMAVGITVRCEHIARLRAHIQAYAKLALADFVPTVSVDFAVSAEELSIEEIEGLQALKPYGTGNPTPCLALCGAKVENLTSIGKGKHLKLTVSEKERRLSCVFFGKTQKDMDFTEGDTVDLLFRPEINEFRGKNVQLLLSDIRPEATEWEQMCQAEALYESVRVGKAEGEALAPFSLTYETFGAIWRAVKHLAALLPEGIPLLTLRRTLGFQTSYEKILLALDVFAELRLLTLERERHRAVIRILPITQKVQLEHSHILQSISQKQRG